MQQFVNEEAVGLYRLVYDSVMLLPFGREGDTEIQAILDVARIRNAELAITGVLYCDGAYFVQLLEGRADAVEAVFASILADERHHDVRVVERGPAERRWFTGWHMAWVSHEHLVEMRRRKPDYPTLRPYRSAELILALNEVLSPQPF